MTQNISQSIDETNLIRNDILFFICHFEHVFREKSLEIARLYEKS